MRRKSPDIVFALIFISDFLYVVYSQNLPLYIDSLLMEGKKVRAEYFKARDNPERYSLNQKFLNIITQIIEYDTGMRVDYEKTFKVKKTSIDSISIIHWNVPMEGENTLYYGFLIIEGRDRVVYQLNQCIKNTDVLESGIYGNDCWPSALYYYARKIFKNRKDTAFYLLLGWDGYGPISDRKIIEILCVSNYKIRWGSPVIKKGNSTLTRLVFEYYEGASFTMRWDENLGGIVFQDLAPLSPSLKDMQEYNVPVETYGLLKETIYSLTLQEKADVRNPPQKHKFKRRR